MEVRGGERSSRHLQTVPASFIAKEAAEPHACQPTRLPALSVLG